MNINNILISACHDPAHNLAFEEYLLENDCEVLYLWQNEPTVVIGRNQNPYKECNLKKLHDDGVHLIRRKSGGGAVFHDLGNLNFTLITKKEPDCVEKNFEFINSVLLSLGISSYVSGRNDIEVQNKKISGSAFFENEKSFCHHGTLLIDSDLNALSSYLTASKLKLKSKGIDSVKSRVTNLKNIVPSINVKKVIDAFTKGDSKEIKIVTDKDIERTDTLKDKIAFYNSHDWVYGESPNYNIEMEKKFDDGIISAELFIDSGKIEKCRISSDSIREESLKDFSASLIGTSFILESIQKKIFSSYLSDVFKENLLELFKENIR